MQAGTNTWTDDDGNQWVEDQDGAFIVKYTRQGHIRMLKNRIKELERVLEQVSKEKS